MKPARAPMLLRVWIVRYCDWTPSSWLDVPPQACVIEPADEHPMTARQAATFLAAFNQAMLAGEGRMWAVATPVIVRYEGDLVAGQEYRKG